MCRFTICLRLILLFCISSASLACASPKIVKTLLHLIDDEGRHMLSPSLLDRDAYQAHLRAHPEKVFGICFDIQLKLKSKETHKLKLAIRHSSGEDLQTFIREMDVVRKGKSQWNRIRIDGEDHSKIGEMIAWRISLLQDQVEIASQESFLW